MTSDDSSRLYILDPEEIDAFSATDGFGSGFGPGWTYKDFIITQVYTKTKEEALKQCGAIFPDVPPDLNPRGYYG